MEGGDTGGLESVNLMVTHLPVWGARRLVLQDLRNALRGRVRLVAARFNVMLLSVDYDDPYMAVRDLRGSLPRDTLILRVIPVYRVVVPPEAYKIRDVVAQLLSKAPPGSFAVRLEGRVLVGGREAGRDEAVRLIAEASDRPVNLRSPDVLVLVKPFRLQRVRGAAVYVGPPDGVLSTAKEG